MNTVMRCSFTLAFLCCLVLLTVRSTTASNTRDTTREDIAAIEGWKRGAMAADLKGDYGFYEAGLSDDWTGGVSWGKFQTKQMLIADLKDAENNATKDEHLSDMNVRLYGDTAIATYRETYDSVVHGERLSKAIITTDTFVKREGKWMQVAAHSSAVAKK